MGNIKYMWRLCKYAAGRQLLAMTVEEDWVIEHHGICDHDLTSILSRFAKLYVYDLHVLLRRMLLCRSTSVKIMF